MRKEREEAVEEVEGRMSIFVVVGIGRVLKVIIIIKLYFMVITETVALID